MEPISKIFFDDSSSEKTSPKLHVTRDSQGDIYLMIESQKDSLSPFDKPDTKVKIKSQVIRLCGPGGGSRYSGLSGKLIKAFFAEQI